ncbi:MAG: ATP-binding cassette domain-containing protein [Gammaproteobacteria bacterium]|jgi:cationic peptide transport system ATP-binding protein|nr:ATP-binding cassette domain-containing protein [Gammaproteobacteria bacterium]
MTSLLEVKNISKYYRAKNGWLKQRRICALEPLSFSIQRGETIAIMGETGSGKSTIARLIAGAEAPSSGEIYLNGELLNPHDYQTRCREIRMIFQDSLSSLNSQLTIGRQLLEPLKFNTGWSQAEQLERVYVILQKVGLLPDHFHFYPHMLSSGQQQRVCIARAIILEPQIIVADEAFASLDPSIRAQIINLILDLQEDMGISFIFASHSPEIVKHVADKILIMHRGKMIEFDSTQALLTNPKEQISKNLLQSEQLNKALKHTTTQE